MSKIEPAPFQVEDMDALNERSWSANWSEMGCYKTSTVCWLIPRWAEQLGVDNPKVLIITTRSGKGTYFKHVPDLLPDYELLNVNTSRINLVLGDMELEYGVPEANGHPIIFVAHYNVFSKRKKKTKKTDEDIADAEDEKQDNELNELEKLFRHYAWRWRSRSARSASSGSVGDTWSAPRKDATHQINRQ